MKNKWVRLGCYWLMAVCLTYGLLWLGHLATGRPHGFQDLWDRALAIGMGQWIVGYVFFWRKGLGANAVPPAV